MSCYSEGRKENKLKNFSNTSFDIIGSNSIYGPEMDNEKTKEVVLRIVATHTQKEALSIFSKELAQAVTGMPAGVINYLGGRPKVSPSIHLFSFLLPKDQIKITVVMDDKIFQVTPYEPKTTKRKLHNSRLKKKISPLEKDHLVPLIKLAYARSGDKGDHANIGVIAREAHFFPYLDNALNPDSISKYFSHVLKGSVLKWIVPGINGINFLLTP